MGTNSYSVSYRFGGLGGLLAGLFGGGGCLFFVLAFLSAFPAWVTHVVVCFRHHDWGYLIAGGLFFPVAVIHGWGIWFGWWH